ncbi:MAG: sugar ABC transporter permease, partial [Actinomycetota bacterium]|nr:sugar ABC transporter permease [Actinomycetota bacterium]
MSFQKWWRTLGWRHLVLLVAVLFALYPLAWMVSASINPIDTLSGARLIPAGASLDNYGQILDNPPASPFMTWLATSWKISL